MPGDHFRLDREVENLNTIHAFNGGGFKSIPRVVAYEDYCQDRLLIETAMIGKPMKPATVKRQTDFCVGQTLHWLVELQQTTQPYGQQNKNWFTEYALHPLTQMQKSLNDSYQETDLIDKTIRVLKPFSKIRIPQVVEHGDLSHPNVIFAKDHGICVVDWELADPHGLPAVDWFFFLSFVAFARQGARKDSEYSKAFHEAFFLRNSWAVRFIAQYRDMIELSEELLKPLFVLCWSRYVAGIVTRLQGGGNSLPTLDEKTLQWLRTNRYYKMWKYTIDHIDQFKLGATRLTLSYTDFKI